MLEIQKTYQINAPVKTVYEKWVSDTTVIPPAVRMEITPEVGGRYLLVSKFGEIESTMEGYFKEVIPLKKIVYTWEWNKDGNESLVTVNFQEEGSGTKIELKHTGLKDRESADAHSQGWDSYIAGFQKLLASDADA